MNSPLRIEEDGVAAEQVWSVVTAMVGELRQRVPRMLGFPANLAWDASAAHSLLSMLINNAGDPSEHDDSGNDVKSFERAVLSWFTGIAGGDRDTYGYVTASGSEGILFGLFVARHRFPRAPVYLSADAHYSVRKAATILRMETVTVPCRDDGTMDPSALARLCRRHRDARGGRPGDGAVVVATIGTVMRGAVDDLPALREAALAAGGVHLHADAALGGLVAAFCHPEPAWNLAHGADSVSVSGHKLLGCPVPCGVVLTPRRYLPPAPTGQYLGAPDHTLGCSRSGLAAALLWCRLREAGTRGVRETVHRCRRTAAYATEALAAAGAHPERFPGALTVTFDRPGPRTCATWHLATQGDRAHLVAMPHVTPQAVDALCADLRGS
ncbi:pyridoxal-dependent decarboxylase [Streptantibioticus cattleyicolor]|uniref:Histidine decarboxylase n=1 Tax=Streptantibioticus cattleyicolor (strain ATCC 35852 / DSM 46488 / JCM 4925 / NBRC 14057 / NRRL 8057) TaxID=1003195 RepID=F8JK20_STREN|nr:pyridoxal-dependent decarboxylase [Streptantibioticus cattleyicolor]AEW99844.1 histidine decarboxylase [Streptantibioticus cattleyicolor NRRL 8057 = DSM 46488]CCB71119.1 putative Histidine decarboxylase [Streptantibioticus cattleyicolor NRRL 8057 = DSM 46488]